MLNDRELALLIWLGVALVLLLWKKDVRSSVGHLIRSAATPTIMLPLIGLVGYVGLEIWFGWNLSLWDRGLIKDTVVWFIVSALALFFGFDKATSQPKFFRRRVIALFSITIFLEFLTNLFVLNLAAELVLQFIVFVVALFAAVPIDNPGYRIIKRVADGCLALIGAALLLFAFVGLIGHWGETDKHDLLLQLVLPIWLTIGLLPYVYLISLYANYDKAFRGINWATEDRSARRRAKLALVTKLHFRIREVHALSWSWAPQLTSAPTLTAARQVVDNFRDKKRDEAQARIEELERLRRYAGSDEVDAEGRRLDRREFKETMSALRWLATCHMGWYHRDNRYRKDMLERLGNDFTREGLPVEAGITMRVSKDGQAWYAWRRTVSGWCFAIGAAGPPADQWEYDGPEPPNGFPGKDPSWGEQAFVGGAKPNWT